MKNKKDKVLVSSEGVRDSRESANLTDSGSKYICWISVALKFKKKKKGKIRKIIYFIL